MAKSTFSAVIGKWVKDKKVQQDQAIRKLALDMFTRIVMRSPVDTGRFRGNWQVSIGGPPSGVLSVEDKSGAVTTTKIASAVSNFQPGQVIWLGNNLPYARRLEYGWSQQAPAGMVRVTVKEFKAFLRKT